MTDEFPIAAAGKPIWLITLADLALILVGFLVLIQATRHEQRGNLAAGLRERFGGEASPVESVPAPVAAAGMMNFAPGSATLPASAAGLVAWAREAVRDPRVTLTVTGMTDGSATDLDPASNSAAILAADRARATAAALTAVVPANRLIITTASRPGQRAALVTLAFTGEKR